MNLYCGIGQGSLGRLHSARLYRVLCLNCKACKQVSTQQPWQDSPSTLLEKSTKWRSPSRLTQVSTPTSRQRRFCINFAILRRTLLIFIFSSAHYCLVPYKTWWYVVLKIKLDNCSALKWLLKFHFKIWLNQSWLPSSFSFIYWHDHPTKDHVFLLSINCVRQITRQVTTLEAMSQMRRTGTRRRLTPTFNTQPRHHHHFHGPWSSSSLSWSLTPSLSWLQSKSHLSNTRLHNWFRFETCRLQLFWKSQTNQGPYRENPKRGDQN